MTNEELKEELSKIIKTTDYIEAALQIKKLEKAYKKTEFYKATRMSLTELVNRAKMWDIFDFSNLKTRIQSLIDDLNFDNIYGILEQFGSTFEKENEDFSKVIEQYSKVIKK